VAALTHTHLQQRDDRWCIVDMVGKHGRVRTVPMPTWVKVAIDAWTSAAAVGDGAADEPFHFFPAKDLRQSNGPFWKRHVSDQQGAPERFHKRETQCQELLRDAGRIQLSIREQVA
jgi:hypothetical protein